MKIISYRTPLMSALAGVALLLGACAPVQVAQTSSTASNPAPTLNPFFYPLNPNALETSLPGSADLAGTPIETPTLLQTEAITTEAIAIETVSTEVVSTEAVSTQEITSAPSSGPTQTLTPTPSPTITPTATQSPTPTAAYRIVPIYYEDVDDKWAVKYSEMMRYNEKDATAAHDGSRSLSFTPLAGFGQLLLTVRQTAKEEYLRSQAVGVRFWLYSGEQEVAPSDLTVSVLGSNRFPFWIKDDHSVEGDQEPVFPETRLYYLDINQTIPPDTWVEINIWLDELIYEPEYQYITGIQIKNDAGFLGTVYIDQVELLMALATE
jgi:hypothetical protein